MDSMKWGWSLYLPALGHWHSFDILLLGLDIQSNPFDKLIGCRDPPEMGQDIENGCLLRDCGPCLAHSIRDEYREVVKEKGVAKGRFHAYVGGGSDENEVSDLMSPQDDLEVRADECIIPLLSNHDVSRLGRQFLYDFTAPCAIKVELVLEVGMAVDESQTL